MVQWNFKSYSDLTKDELYDLLQLRSEVFVVEQNAAYQDLDGKDQESFHLFGTLNQKVIAYARCIPAGLTFDEPCLGRVVTSKTVRRSGYGRILVTLALEAMKTQFGTEVCRISAQKYLKTFYASFGFVQVSDMYLEDGLPHIEMVRE